MQKIDKIFFDIDGVIRGVASPKEDAMALLRLCMDKDPRDPEMAKKALEFLKG